MWALTVSGRRARSQWRLLVVIATVAVLACSLICSLALLVAQTEQGGLRTQLARTSTPQLDLTLFQTTAPLAEVGTAVDSALHELLGPSVAVSLDNSSATSDFYEMPALTTDKTALAFAGEYSAIRANSTLTSGAWPRATGEVALPQEAVEGFGLALGDTVTLEISDDPVTVTISGTYSAAHPQNDFWQQQPLKGQGFDAMFPQPGLLYFVPTNAMGPLIFAPDGMDAAGVPIDRVDLAYLPDFSKLVVADLPGLVDRLKTSYQDVPANLGAVDSFGSFSTTLDESTAAAATGIAVTRSTVVVIGLLVLLLAIAALAQTARLLVEARVGERRLMISRGASRWQVLALAFVEALAIGVLTAVLGPLVASAVYAVLAAQPAMAAAGMPATAPPSGFVLAGAVALAFVVILVAPLLRQSRAVSRQRRGSGIMSSGLDIGLVVLAAVAYWQLGAYRSPVAQSTDLAVDPLLVASPALVLLAGALVAVRFIPLAAKLFEILARRSRGALLALAAWEVGRRTRQAIAAVLLLTLAVAVASFSLSFLSTWRQSQTDQADIAIGAPVRVPVVESSSASQRELLGGAEPTTRRVAGVAGPGVDLTEGVPPSTKAVVMGLTPAARAILDRGRLGTEGGSALTPTLDTELEPASGVTLDPAARGISATIEVRTPGEKLTGVTFNVFAVLQDPAGVLSVIDLGSVPVDGASTPVRGEFQPGIRGTQRVVGFQFQTSVASSDDLLQGEDGVQSVPALGSDVDASVLVGNVSSLVTAELTPVAAPVDAALTWFGISTQSRSAAPEVLEPAAGWQWQLDLLLPASIAVDSVTYSLLGWEPVTTMSAVVTKDLARAMYVTKGALVFLVTGGSVVPVQIDAVTPLIPGSSSATAVSAGGEPVNGAIVVDEEALSRALIQHGVVGQLVDEWWVDVPAGEGRAYLDAHHTVPGVSKAESREVAARTLQEGPLRVATQSALWLAIAAAALLAAVGFAVHTAATLSSRRTELAQLRAIGFTRRSIIALIGAESALLAAIGTVFGIALGVLLGYLAGPLIAISPTGRPTEPAVIVEIPWVSILLLVLELLAVLGVVVAGVARAQKSSDPASLLRAGG